MNHIMFDVFLYSLYCFVVHTALTSAARRLRLVFNLENRYPRIQAGLLIVVACIPVVNFGAFFAACLAILFTKVEGDDQSE